jgi:hypothetical protein
MPATPPSHLEPLLHRLEIEIAERARRTRREALWRAAASYRRSERMLAGLLPPALLREALADGSDPEITWQVLRWLCRHLRFNARSPLGSRIRFLRCQSAAAGETRLLLQQRMAHHEQAMFSSLFAAGRQTAC